MPSEQRYFVILRRIGANWLAGTAVRKQPGWDEHAAYMDQLHARGHIALGGPFTDGTGALLIVRAHDVQEARAMLEADPWVTQDVLDRGEVKGWEVFLDGWSSSPKEEAASTSAGGSVVPEPPES